MALLFYSRSDIHGYNKVPSKFIEKIFRMLHNNWWFVSFHFALYINDFLTWCHFYFLKKFPPLLEIHPWPLTAPNLSRHDGLSVMAWSNRCTNTRCIKEMRSTFVEIVFSFFFVCCVFFFPQFLIKMCFVKLWIPKKWFYNTNAEILQMYRYWVEPWISILNIYTCKMLCIGKVCSLGLLKL